MVCGSVNWAGRPAFNVSRTIQYTWGIDRTKKSEASSHRTLLEWVYFLAAVTHGHQTPVLQSLNVNLYQWLSRGLSGPQKDLDGVASPNSHSGDF
jgi:hypothetical protein